MHRPSKQPVNRLRSTPLYIDAHRSHGVPSIHVLVLIRSAWQRVVYYFNFKCALASSDTLRVEIDGVETEGTVDAKCHPK